jgi:cation diffusion facilitator CzcD-associated flavoprotein CzcO
MGVVEDSVPFTLKDEPLDGHRRMKIRVVGAGYSGIYLGIRIPQRLRNVDLRIYEKNESVGGTWWVNRYPGMPLYSSRTSSSSKGGLAYRPISDMRLCLR